MNHLEAKADDGETFATHGERFATQRSLEVRSIVAIGSVKKRYNPSQIAERHLLFEGIELGIER